jgi:hypothetical protein
MNAAQTQPVCLVIRSVWFGPLLPPVVSGARQDQSHPLDSHSGEPNFRGGKAGSNDWFHRRANEIDRLRDALEAARDAEGPALSGANRDGILTPAAPDASEPAAEAPPPPLPELRAPPYVPSSFTVSVGFEPHEAPPELLFDLVCRIVEAEGPIHRDLIARRVGAAFGKARTGVRIRTVSDVTLDRAVAQGRLTLDGEFAMTAAQFADPPVRDRSEAEAPANQAGLLPPVEIRAAGARVLAESGKTPREELIVATARLLGFARVGAELRGVMDAALIWEHREQG